MGVQSRTLYTRTNARMNAETACECPEHPCPQDVNVHVTSAWDAQSIHARTMRMPMFSSGRTLRFGVE